LFSFQSVYAVQVCSIYDDFSTGNLNLTKWEESTGFQVNAFTDEHFVNTSQEVYHIQQNTPGDRETNLRPKREFVANESFSYEVTYSGGIGNHFSQPLINGNYPQSQIEPCTAPGGCGAIGFFNGLPDLGAQIGTYLIIFEFSSNQVKMTSVRPDNVSIVNTFTGNSAPYNLTINTHTGHNGLMHFDYDNVEICVEASALPDLDNDSISDINDLCPNTKSGEDVDLNGCSNPQFCAQQNMCGIGCEGADWKNNEQGVEFPGDCTTAMVNRGGETYPTCAGLTCAN